MRLNAILVWQPTALARIGILAAAVVLALCVGYVHAVTGLAFEFHVMFILPILPVAWFVGTRAGYTMSVLVATLWLVVDRMLAGAQADALPLLFNSSMRLMIFLGSVWLVGGMRRAFQRESKLAREDALTQLPNRREFNEQGRRAFAQAYRQSVPMTVAFIDLDRFKEVNDRLGHDAGDHVLIEVADAIRSHVRASDVPGRLGGDEFALILPDMNPSAAAPYLENLRNTLLDAMRRHGWPVTFSIGVASYDITPRHFDDALAEADALMYEVKSGGRDRILQRSIVTESA